MAVSITSRKTTVKDQQRSRRKAPRNSEPWPQLHHCASKDFSGGSGVKKPANAGEVGDAGSIPKSRRSPGERNGNPLQYSCLENPTDRGAWRAIVHGVTESDTTEWLRVHTEINQQNSDVSSWESLVSASLSVSLWDAHQIHLRALALTQELLS